jgi:23S rRNA (pseudouridine1915-N3)-methyltransferase
MRISLVSVGQRMPDWIEQGFNEYAKRLPRENALHLVEVPAFKRTKNTVTEVAMQNEGERILAAIAKNNYVVVLDEHGKTWDTLQLAEQMRQWAQSGVDVSLVVGGTDGLSPQVKAKADRLWSLSALTLPHPLVRVIIAEQIYRAWSVMTNHPYHRA